MSEPNTAMDSGDDATMMDDMGAQHRRWCWSPKCAGELASTDKFGLCDNCRRKMVDVAKKLGGAVVAVGAGLLIFAQTTKSQSEEDGDADSSEDDADDEE